MNETWRPIAGYDGYQVSDLGRVRSLDRVVTKMQRGRPVQHRLKGKVLRPATVARGYLAVALGRRGTMYVHHVVLLAFVGPRPAGKQAAHGDGDRTNNALSNLRWATPKENTADRYRHGTVLFNTRHPLGRKTHCHRGHPFDEGRRADGRRACATCQRDRKRRANGTPPWRFREAIDLRVRQGLRLMAAGMSAIRAAQVAKVGRKTLGGAWRSVADL
jgi:hypothetical protein